MQRVGDGNRSHPLHVALQIVVNAEDMGRKDFKQAAQLRQELKDEISANSPKTKLAKAFMSVVPAPIN